MTKRRSATALRAVGAVAMAVSLGLGAGVATAAPGDETLAQPELGAKVKDIIEVDDLEFKDLNDNGELDVYEDWRKPVEDRVADLVSQMTTEEKAGLMLIQTLNSGCEGTVPTNAYDFVENQYMHRFIFRNVVDSAYSPCGAGGTVVTPAQAATFTNSVQEMTEATRLGIPSLFKSNARNHIEHDARFGINEAAGAFTSFPKEAGIASAALGDDSYVGIVDQFATVMGDEWASIGLRGMYGYMADLSTDPRWYRVHETFTEDADLGADIMRQLVETLQGEADENGLSLTPDTHVALTMKHFPGGGPQALGLDPHYAHGKPQVYPGDGFEEALKPFKAAIDAGVSSIMPYYGAPVDVTFDGVPISETGFAFSEEIVEWLLRDQLGFQGYVNSDTGIINDRAWGLEDATVPERVAAAVNGGTDTLSGFSQVSVITDLIDDELISIERVDLAAERLLTPMFQMGLFENPYVDPELATATVGADAHIEVAQEIQRKSVVLLQNSGVLPLSNDKEIFVLGEVSEEQIAEVGFEVINGNEEGVEAAAGADVAVINVTAATDRTVTGAYRSNFDDTGWFNPATGEFKDADDPTTDQDFYVVGGMDPEYGVNGSILEGIPGLDGNSPWGASDRCIHDQVGSENINNPNPTPSCTDNRLGFGGSLPWEANVLDFTGMSQSQSWKITPSLDEIQAVMDEVGAENTVLSVYFRQPYVLDEASGLQDAGAIVAGFGVTDLALWDVLSGNFEPQGKMPFALANNVQAVIDQEPDLPGYPEEDTLFAFAHGLSYDDGVEVVAHTAGTKLVGNATNLWGNAVGAEGEAIVAEVLVGDGWVEVGSATVAANGSYVLPLSGDEVAARGEYTLRVRVGEDVSDEFSFTRIARSSVNAAQLAPLGRTANAWGTVDGQAEIRTQVFIPGQGWSTSQVGATNASGGYVIPLTYGADVANDYRWRLVVDHAHGEREFTAEFTQSRVAAPTASSAGTARVGANANVWGTVDAGQATAVWTEVFVPGKGWSTSQKATTNATGGYVLPLTYGHDVAGSYQFRVAGTYPGIGTLYSSQFTFVRTN